tara:strand:+ start:2212 stop:2445 length:234 start_codon:yes stop_codon:yes gene_type:complete
LSHSKYPLDFELYNTYHIDHRYKAFVIEFESIDENECDNYEANYIEQGYKIFHVSMNRNSKGLFNLKLIVAQMGFTF